MDAVVTRLLTVRDLASAFSVTTRTIENWVAAGRLPPPVRVGARSKRWHADVLNDLRPSETTSSPQPVSPIPTAPTKEELMSFFGTETDPDADMLLRRDAVESMLSMSTIELFGLVRSGELATVDLGDGIRRFRLRDVEEYRSAHLVEWCQRMKREQFCDRNPDAAE